MEKKKETRGRKPVTDKKEALQIYVEGSVIHANGGKEKCIEIFKAAIKPKN